MGRIWDVAIIGGGVVGVSTARQLSELGAEVILFESESIPSHTGSTTRSAGGYRHQFDDDRKIKLVKRSLNTFRRYAAHSTSESLQERGYLFLAQTESEAAPLRQSVDTLSSHGIRSEFLNPEECQTLVPRLRVEDVRAGRYCAQDGLVDPAGFMHWLAEEAVAAGATLREGEPVTAIESTEQFEIQTPEDTHRATAILNAAGVWAPRIAAELGAQLEIMPARVQIVETDQHYVSESAPFVVDIHEERYFWPGATGTNFGGATTSSVEGLDPETYDRTYDSSFVAQTESFAEKRLGIDDLTIINGWAGLKGLTPDGDPLVGEIDACDGFYVATGWNGHGFMLAPAVAQELAAHILTGEWADVDLSAYDPDRFSEGFDSDRSFMGT